LSIFYSASIFAEQTPQSLADAQLPSLLTIYKDFHTHPELSGHEERSAAIVAKELKAAGCDVTERVGKYDKPGLTCFGVVGVMKNGAGPTVLVRSDLDALPVHEETGLPYASLIMRWRCTTTLKSRLARSASLRGTLLPMSIQLT
jgi:hippurate hydrolase